MLKSTIVNPGTGKSAIVDDQSLVVSSNGLPPSESLSKAKPFRQFLTDDGLSTGSEDMLVAGSSAVPLDFFVNSSTEGDRYITGLSFLIAAPAAALNVFGTGTGGSALTNGVQVFYQDSELGNVDIAPSLLTNFDFIRLCQGNPAFGDGAAAFRAQNAVAGTNEAYFPTLDFQKTFGLQYGIKIPKATQIKIVIRIKDDLTGAPYDLTAFNVIAYGFDRIK
jgi:hypothetical protein